MPIPQPCSLCLLIFVVAVTSFECILCSCSLSILWDQLKDDFRRDGFFREGSQADGQERQRGVVRTNCIDCLDRTNVVQGLLGRKHLEAVLDRAGLLDATDQLAFPNTFPLVSEPCLLLTKSSFSWNLFTSLVNAKGSFLVFTVTVWRQCH